LEATDGRGREDAERNGGAEEEKGLDVHLSRVNREEMSNDFLGLERRRKPVPSGEGGHREESGHEQKNVDDGDGKQGRSGVAAGVIPGI
jgi:hypothetical protein